MFRLYSVLFLFIFTIILVSLMPKASANTNWDFVKEDIVLASHDTDFDVGELAAVAFVESSFRPTISAAKGTATGLMQITEPTARHLLDTYGLAYGLELDSDLHDPYVSALLGAMYLTEIRDIMRGRLGREPELIDVYLGYKFSPYRAVRMLQANPNSTLISFYPEASSRNKSVYYKRNGKARTIGEVKSMFENRLLSAYNRYYAEASYLLTLLKVDVFNDHKTGDCGVKENIIELAEIILNESTRSFLLVESAPVYVEGTMTNNLAPCAPSGKKYHGFYV